MKFEFHDYKSKGITEEKLKAWTKQVGWENLVNKRGTTWRQLDETIQKKITKIYCEMNVPLSSKLMTGLLLLLLLVFLLMYNSTILHPISKFPIIIKCQ